MSGTSRHLPLLLDTAIHGRFVRVAAWLALLLVVLFFSGAGVQSLLTRRVEAFVQRFIASVGAEAGSFERFLAPGFDARAEVRELKRWMTPERRLLHCKPILLPFSRYYECVAQFTNGAFVYVDVDGHHGQKLVTVFQVTPPETPR